MRGIRNARNEANVEPARWIEAIIAAGAKMDMITRERATISRLARVEAGKLQIVETLEVKPHNATGLVAGAAEIYLPLAGMVDLAEERARLQKELERVKGDVARREAKLSNANFVDRAPAAIVQGERDLLATAQATAAKLRAQVAALATST